MGSGQAGGGLVTSLSGGGSLQPPWPEKAPASLFSWAVSRHGMKMWTGSGNNAQKASVAAA